MRELIPDSQPELSLVLACYNEEPHLLENVRAIAATLGELRAPYELIFVDDVSKDGTRRILTELPRRFPHVDMTVLFHDQNLGRGAAVTTGFNRARGRFAGYIDIDLEVGPHYILPCLMKLRAGADVVTARRIYKSESRLPYRELMSRGYAQLMRTLLGLSIQDSEAGFKFFSRDVLERLLPLIEDKHWFWDTEIMSVAHVLGMRIEDHPCLFLRDHAKKSTVRVLRDSFYYVRRLCEFRPRLLRLRLEQRERSRLRVSPSLRA